MRKRPHQLVVLSSSDEEDYSQNVYSSNRTACNSKLGFHGERKKHKAEKGSSRCTKLQKSNLNGTENWPAFFPETFSEFLPLQKQSTVSNDRNWRPSSVQSAETNFWIEKYKPRTLIDLAVNKKKVADVKAWIEGQISSKMEHSGSRVLLLTGPTGVGKTATVHLLIDLMRIEICEWETPTPTLWREYIHHVNSGASYISKLDEFESFVDIIRKYPILPMGSAKRSGKSENAMVIVIDDLPIPHGRESCQRLCQCLQTLAQTAQFPTIVLVTELNEAAHREGSSQMILEMELALEQGGATKISLNPVTTSAIMKTLGNIWKAEYLSKPPDWLSYISESSGGDIRHAINSLQFLCLDQTASASDPQGSECLSLPKSYSRKQSQKKAGQSSTSVRGLEFMDNVKSRMGRDGTLSLFHALGKFLHNKRQTDQIADSGIGCLVLKEEFVRYPLKMDVPELVLSQANAEPGTFSAFLHENVLDFISEEAIDDAWMAVSYLSDSDCLLGAGSSRYRRRIQTLLEWDEVDSAFVVEALAGSIMSRGVLFANSHPAPSRWQCIRGPTLCQVERSSHKKKMEMFSERWAFGSLLKTCRLSVWATEYKPVMHLLGQSAFNMQLKPIRDDYDRELDKGLSDSEVGIAESDSVNVDDFLSDTNILSTLNVNSGHNQTNNNLSDMQEDMDEIEDW